MQNILVVEDDYDLNQAICYSLKKSGYGVYGVTFMKKGKQTFIENQIDLILLDVNLPDGEGFSFCQWVKKQREVPVIYLTAVEWTTIKNVHCMQSLVSVNTGSLIRRSSAQ